MAQKPIFSVVEELKGISLNDFIDRVYDPGFWIPFIPLSTKEITKTDKFTFEYKVGDTIYMDPTKTLKYDFESNGTILVHDEGDQGDKGKLWKLDVDVKHPASQISVNIRAKDTDKGLKTGFFIYKLEYDLGALKDFPFGHDAIIFAGRLKLRELIQKFGKEFLKMK